MNKSYLLLGSNMGDSGRQLKSAIKLIEQKIGQVTHKSGLYQTAAWGNTDQPDFLNQVIIVATKLQATELLKQILLIEEEMGRVRTIKNAPRIIDIDILFFNKDIISKKNLTIPHPEIANRKFVLIPLNELSPNFKHPILNKSIHQLLLACTDELNVKKVLTA
ncbi:MAG: 2-amino-4-hydroxy-6-hydroxymethyldihydropteridine diphosphokinase [Ferruginibacter sp.]